MAGDLDGGGTVWAGKPDLDLMTRACAVVSRSFSIEADSPDDWTQAVAGDLHGLIGVRVGVMAMIAQWRGDEGTWETVSLGLAGDYPEGAVRALHEQAHAGWPDDDFSRSIGHAGPVPPAACAARDRFIHDDLWRECACRKTRSSIGLHDFARAIVPFDDPSGRRVMVLQVDGVTPTWRASARTVSTLACIMHPAFEAYRTRFVEGRVARAKLLDRLSPTQRRIAPMLAEGLTEAEIAQRIHRSAHTVHDHTRSIYRALGVNSRLGLRDLWLGR